MCVSAPACVCPLTLRTPLNSRGGHIRGSALAGTAKSGSRSGIPTLMLTVTLCCLTISLAACKSVVLGDQVNLARSTDPASRPPHYPSQRRGGKVCRWECSPWHFQFLRGILAHDHPLRRQCFLAGNPDFTQAHSHPLTCVDTHSLMWLKCEEREREPSGKTKATPSLRACCLSSPAPRLVATSEGHDNVHLTSWLWMVGKLPCLNLPPST